VHEGHEGRKRFFSLLFFVNFVLFVDKNSCCSWMLSSETGRLPLLLGLGPALGEPLAV
jgi:hypothetical protein